MENSCYTLRMPRSMVAGPGASTKIQDALAEMGAAHVAVFTDKGVAAAGLLAGPLAAVQAAGAACTLLDDIPPEPAYGAVQQLLNRFMATGADCVLAVGGGSVLDTAKLASVICPKYTVADLLETPGLAKKQVPSIMVPTTAGTGAEATPNAIVAVPEKELKVGIVSPEMIADTVVLDAEMLRALPQHIAAATGVDALAHAIECYTGGKATPFSDMYAMRAMQLIFPSILPACNEAGNMQAKENMLLASFYAGVAITASGTTAVHALSYPLGGKYHIPHGVSNAILLAPVMSYNAPACAGRLAEIYDMCFAGSASAPADKPACVIQQLQEIVRQLQIPTSLAGFGVTGQALPGLVDAAMQVTRLLDNNPRQMTHEAAAEIYAGLLEGDKA